jgi:hypothetical protein
MGNTSFVHTQQSRTRLEDRPPASSPADPAAVRASRVITNLRIPGTVRGTDWEIPW